MKKKLGFKTYDKYLGIRYDEPHRAARNRDHKLPLYDLRITKLQRNQFWEAQPFQLEIHDYYGNCDLCFWKPDWLIIKMIRENPGIEKWWIDQENRAGATFKKEISYTQLAYLAGSQRQILFPENQDYPMECNFKDN